METIGWVFGVLGFVFGINAMTRVSNLEKKLKQFDVIPRNFDSEKEPTDAESV